MLQLPKTERILAEDVARAVGDMMVETCDSGSAAKAFRGRDGLPRAVKVAGKTGTLSRKPAPDAPAELEYSWFVGYAPADQPQFSVSVVLGNTDLWWLKSHTAARMILRDALRELSPKK
jgi:peptidoglycan glycosyltransferase